VKETFRNNLHLSRQNIDRLYLINSIIDEYASEGYRLTLRQLYYQLVSRIVIPNSPAEYGKLSNLLVSGRMAGVVDWNAIEDRVRIPYMPFWTTGIPDALQTITDQYRLDRQEGQDNYIEVWCEKDALSGVLKRITSHYHVYLMVNRGYSSCTAMYDAAKRFQDRYESNGQNGYILYLGDHDPSGLDMIRDISTRLDEFGVEVEVRHLALKTEQVQRYNPPPNPMKIKDPRAGWYIGKFGNTSWEVDALNPKTLHALIEEQMEELIDMELFNDVLAQEKKDIQKLKAVVKENS